MVFVERRLDHGQPTKGRGDAHIDGAVTPPLPEGKEGGAGTEVASVKPTEEYSETWLRLEDLPKKAAGVEMEIEELIVRELMERHTRWINAGAV